MPLAEYRPPDAEIAIHGALAVLVFLLVAQASIRNP